MFPWNASLPLAVNVLGGGIVLLPNSRITVHAQLRDLNDNELTGFAAQEWVLESDGRFYDYALGAFGFCYFFLR